MQEAIEESFRGFERALAEFCAAPPDLKHYSKSKLLNEVDKMSRSREGLGELFRRTESLLKSNLFAGTVWAEPKKLNASLVKGTLQCGHPSSTLEILSDLRLLACSQKKYPSQDISKNEASEKIANIVIHNLEFALSEPSEESRIRMSQVELNKAICLFSFLMAKVDHDRIKDTLAKEIEAICAQRPVVTCRVRKLVAVLNTDVSGYSDGETDEKLVGFINAIYHPTQAARKHRSLKAYEDFLKNSDQKVLANEAEAMGKAIQNTGLVSQHHATLLEILMPKGIELVGACLGLRPAGMAELEKQQSLIYSLIEENVRPHNSQCIYGLSCMINQSQLSNHHIRVALENLRKIRLNPKVEQRILDSSGSQSPNVSARQYLLGASFRVLGQPLGVGQGNNPTCQSARAISMWSMHSPARLLDLIAIAASQDRLIFRFEGKELNSMFLGKGLAESFDLDLDAVSIVLVPHLDRIYGEMMKLAAGRGEDGHKWVNPAMYGSWVPLGFSSAYDYPSDSIVDFRGFARMFFANFHKDYNGDRNMVYPNPVGIFLTSASGDRVGFHAVSMLRVERDPEGVMRVYFLNPNNEGRQNWGQGIEPSVWGKGEQHGESSLPVHQFAARVYAFHYQFALEHKPIPNKLIDEVETLARESWGRSYSWVQKPKWRVRSDPNAAP